MNIKFTCLGALVNINRDICRSYRERSFTVLIYFVKFINIPKILSFIVEALTVFKGFWTRILMLLNKRNTTHSPYIIISFAAAINVNLQSF